MFINSKKILVWLISLTLFGGGWFTTGYAISEDLNNSADGELTLSGKVTGLSGQLFIELNKTEIVKISDSGDFNFKNRLHEGQEYSVVINKPPANHRCEIKNGHGIINARNQTQIAIECQQTGKWIYPTSIENSLSIVGHNAQTPAAAMNKAGNAVVAWAQNDGTSWRIYKSEFRDGKWDQPASLGDAVSPSGTNAMDPKVAIADNGDIVIAWVQFRGKKHHIYIAEYRKGKWTMPKSLDQHVSPGEKAAWQIDIAMDADGNTIIVWDQESYIQDYAIYFSEYRDGSWRHPPSVKDAISKHSGKERSDALGPRVAMNNSGKALITWEQRTDGFTRIYKSEYLGGRWVHPKDTTDFISPSDGGNAGKAIPVLAGNGMSLIAWQQSNDNRRRIYKSEYDGSKWIHPLVTDAISPLTIDNDNAEINSVTINNKGDAIILWSLQRLFNQALYLSYHKDGKWYHPDEKNIFVGSLDPNLNNKVLGKVAMSDSGKTVVAWQQMDDKNISKVYIAEYDNDVWYLPGRKISLLNHFAWNVNLVSAVNGNFLVVWQQKNDKFEQIYMSEYHVLKK